LFFGLVLGSPVVERESNTSTWFIIMLLHLLWTVDVISFNPWEWIVNRSMRHELERERRRQTYLAYTGKLKRESVLRLADEGEFIDGEEGELQTAEHSARSQ